VCTVTDEHILLTGILDNTSQVHCNQHMIDQDPKQYVGGIPFMLCLGLSGPGTRDIALGDLVSWSTRPAAGAATDVMEKFKLRSSTPTIFSSMC